MLLFSLMVVYLLYWRIMDIQWKLNVEWSRTARIMEVMERDMETERARMVSKVFHVQGHHHTGTDFLTHINTRSPVVKAVKLMACRQAKSSLKIPS